MSRKVPENSAFAPMAEADKLCDLLYLWLKNRKHCAEKLLALAKELEEVHEIKTASQVVGNATSLIALSTAGVASFLTGGLAAPLLFATVGTVAGAAVDITSTAIEAIISGKTMKEANHIVREDEEIGENIQELIDDLKEKCGVQQSGAHRSTNVGCEVATQIMGALARRNNIDVPLNLLRSFIRFTFTQNVGGLYADGAVPQHLISTAVKFMCVQLGIKELGKSAAYAGAKAGFKVFGAIGIGVSLYSLISSCKEMLKSNQRTQASRALRDASREIQEARRKLEEQLDAMNKITEKMAELKNLIENLGTYSDSMNEDGEKIINYVIQSWTDDEVISWLKTLPHKTDFLNLLRYFIENLWNLPERLKKKKKQGGHVDIVIVAHGEITNALIPASLLMPAPTIVDTVLYSPWNCLIDSFAACAIAKGWYTTDGRCLYNHNQPVQFEPNPLPNHWNHMQRSFNLVPWILLTPVYPEEPVWDELYSLQGHVDRDGRIIIPYIVPKKDVKVFGKMPFFLFIIALSYILMLNDTTATVHLAACLGRGEKCRLMKDHWLAQYAYTNDRTCMTTINRDFSNDRLFRAFRAMFDRNGR